MYRCRKMYFSITKGRITFKYTECNHEWSTEHKDQKVAGLFPQTDDQSEELLDTFDNPSHLTMAHLLHKMTHDIFVNDGKNVWMFQERWQKILVKCEDVRKAMSTHLNPTWEERIRFLNELLKNTEDEIKKEEIVRQIRVARYGKQLLNSTSDIKSIVDCFKTIIHDSTPLDRCDKDPLKLGCQNGYIDIIDMKLKPYTKDIFITRSIGYDYFESEEQKCTDFRNEWLDFVTKFFPIVEERQIAQIYAGYCLRGDHPEKIFCVFKDKIDGNNGKTKFATALKKALSCYANDGNAEHIYRTTGHSNQNGHNAALFAYLGSLLAIFEEMDEKRTVDTKKMKRNHGGNQTDTGRRPHERDDETVGLFTKHILIFNDRCQPKYDTSDSSFIKKMLVLPFRSKFFCTEAEMENSDLPYKYLADPFIDDIFERLKPYILDWMLQGHQMYLQKGFTEIPTSCQEWKNEVSEAVDDLKDWLEEVVEVTGDEEDVVSYLQIRDRMTSSMRSRFKDKQHLLDKLKGQLENYVKDSGKGENRIKDGSKRHKLRPKPSAFL